MKTQQFNDLKAMLQGLTTSQLKSLQNEISRTLSHKKAQLLTNEERDLLAKLFS
ncbi:hypothetical protein [Vibrio sagamiensis]|uniref:Uncharacterized protein n=1 Tax=Vibrio sagamiensis NBRC 104589 TaxID=1219064 RepID=A0A511QEQ5_9VIBR|nr:hypothetical protein [Vibrio sagamiensis]GEM75783.1 hypothetical protein VSA01S_18950 [Vibrio sagamiensis NBRC 104589]